MDFFQHQEDARKSSRKLIVYFALAVAGIVLSVHLALSFLVMWVEARSDVAFDWWAIDRFVAFAGGTLLVITVGSLYKIWRLSDGGNSVAELLGGRPLSPNTTDAKERRVLNVVEEMAIAAGVPVPTVYLLEEESSINAFAAGLTPQDAVIGVTRGTIDLLSRDELQGVIAHEFSHIFNGDSRLNLRLMGVLHGILVVALIGYFILRSSVRASASSRGRKGGGAVLALPLLGLVLVVVGYIGVFFGRLIKSAVSRQREFLADASAVQFTRNPESVAGALKKIGGLGEGSLIMSPHAEQASHFFFSDAKLAKARRALTGVTHFAFLATHPPLEARIRRIEPRWNGRYPRVEPIVAPVAPIENEMHGKSGERSRDLGALFPVHLTALIGTLDEAHLAYARTLLAGIPDRLREAAHDPAGARAVVLALLTDRDERLREHQLGLIDASEDTALAEETRRLADVLASSPREWRLPLVDLALPALKRMSEAQYESFSSFVQRFIEADRQIDLFEYTLMHLLDRHLAPAFKRVRPPSIEYYGLATVRHECSTLLSAVAHAGHKDEGEARKAFESSARELGGITLSFVPRGEAGLAGVKRALEKLARVAPKLKRELMRAFIASVAHDGEVTAGEGELLRAIADALGLPMPPLLPGQTVELP